MAFASWSSSQPSVFRRTLRLALSRMALRILRLGKRGSPGKRRSVASQSTSWQTLWRRTSRRPWCLRWSRGCRAGDGLALDEQADLGGQRGPVVLEGEQVVGALGADRSGDPALAADGDQRLGEFEPLELARDDGELVARLGSLAADRPLAEDEALP